MFPLVVYSECIEGGDTHTTQLARVRFHALMSTHVRLQYNIVMNKVSIPYSTLMLKNKLCCYFIFEENVVESLTQLRP